MPVVDLPLRAVLPFLLTLTACAPNWDAPDGPRPSAQEAEEPREPTFEGPYIPSEPVNVACMRYLSCVDAVEPESLAVEEDFFGPEGECIGSSWLDVPTCAAVCDELREALWRTAPEAEACWSSLPEASLPADRVGTVLRRGALAPDFAGRDQYGRPLSLGQHVGQPLVIALEPSGRSEEFDLALAQFEAWRRDAGLGAHWVTVPWTKGPDTADATPHRVIHSVLELDSMPAEVEAYLDLDEHRPLLLLVDPTWRVRRAVSPASAEQGAFVGALDALLRPMEQDFGTLAFREELEPNETTPSGPVAQYSGGLRVAGYADRCEGPDAAPERGDLVPLSMVAGASARITLTWERGHTDLEFHVVDREGALHRGIGGPDGSTVLLPSEDVAYLSIWCASGAPTQWTLHVDRD